MDDWEVIYSYSRSDAIRDEVLIDVSKFAQEEVGFKVPVAITSALSGYVNSDLPGQSINGRLWDVLCLLHLKAKGSDKDTIFYDVIFQMTEDKHETVNLKAVIGPGDDLLSPVLTIMLSTED
jgi:hypothetical protein